MRAGAAAASRQKGTGTMTQFGWSKSARASNNMSNNHALGGGKGWCRSRGSGRTNQAGKWESGGVGRRRQTSI